VGDFLHGLEIARGGDGEAGLDDVHVQALELAGHLQLFVEVHGGAGALLPVAQGGIKNIRVYVNGEPLGTTGDYSDRAFPLDPGLYRVVLDQKSGGRNYRDDVDIIVGRLTVLDIEIDNDFFDGDYDVEVYFD
jgi:hypothetical protein